MASGAQRALLCDPSPARPPTSGWRCPPWTASPGNGPRWTGHSGAPVHLQAAHLGGGPTPRPSSAGSAPPAGSAGSGHGAGPSAAGGARAPAAGRRFWPRSSPAWPPPPPGSARSPAGAAAALARAAGTPAAARRDNPTASTARFGRRPPQRPRFAGAWPGGGTPASPGGPARGG